MVFNLEVYKLLNPDLRFKKANDYIKHYMIVGKKQGRKSSILEVYPDFNIEQYKANYSDLSHLSGIDLIKHWLSIGYKEGRLYIPLNKLKHINGIDIIYWINLDRSTDRRSNMEKFLSKVTIPNIRIKGSDGKFENVKDSFKNTVETTSNSEYGCLLSHLRTIKKFWESGLERCLILEDDITLEFIKYWKHDLNTIISGAPDDWDIIGLTQTLNNNSNIKGLYTPFWYGFYSAQGYIINKNGADKIMKLYKLDKWEINLSYHTTEKVVFGNTKMYIYKYPYFTYNLENTSTIHTDHYGLHKLAKENSIKMWKEQ
jgi:GR25 family glycosyltransferase involved in LPS biosynthesis